MSNLGGPGNTVEVAGSRLFSGGTPGQAVCEGVSTLLRNAVYYGTAVLAVTVAVVLDQINTSRARDAAAADAGLVADQLAAEASVVGDVKRGEPVTIASGIMRAGELCVLNAIVEGSWVILIAREQDDDPDSLQAFAVGVLGDSGGVGGLEATTVGWNPPSHTYVVGSPDSLFKGTSVGVGLPVSETSC